MRGQATIFFVTLLFLINITASSDNNENLKSLLSDDSESVTPLSKATSNQNQEIIHPDINEKRKKPPISVVGIDDDGKRTDAIDLKNPINETSNIEKTDKDSSSIKDTNNDVIAKDDNIKNEDIISNITEEEKIDEAFLPAEGAAEKEHSSSLAIFFVLFVLVLCIFLIHFMLQNKCHYIPESLAIVFLGTAVYL